MSTLNLSALTPAGGTRVPVVIQLCDSTRRPISAYTVDGVVVSKYQSRTATDGTLSVDIPANADILDADGNPVVDTFYLVIIGPATRLILKTSSTQTLAEAEAAAAGGPD